MSQEKTPYRWQCILCSPWTTLACAMYNVGVGRLEKNQNNMIYNVILDVTVWLLYNRLQTRKNNHWQRSIHRFKNMGSRLEPCVTPLCRTRLPMLWVLPIWLQRVHVQRSNGLLLERTDSRWLKIYLAGTSLRTIQSKMNDQCHRRLFSNLSTILRMHHSWRKGCSDVASMQTITQWVNLDFKSLS